jgi:hypothetical protein
MRIICICPLKNQSMKAILKSRLSAVFTVVAMVLFTFSSCKKDDEVYIPNHVTVTLTGAQEVPSNTSTGTGTATFTFDPVSKTIAYTMTWTLGSTSATTTNMHFHGSDTGTDLVSSPVVIGITGFTTAYTGTISGTTRALTDVEVAQLMAGKWYLNVHSSTVPGGEIRGNIKFN